MPEKGLPVFLEYDQDALDAAYDQAAYAPNRAQLIERRIRDSELARRCIGEPERVAYGATEIERLDIYRTAGAVPAPVFVFIHGGAWRSGRSQDCAGPAEMFLAAGAHYVVPDFAWVQDVGGSLMVVADQVRRAVAWVFQNIARFGGDPNRLYLGGQSSGGHLAAVALTTDWRRDFGLPADIIKGGVCISGMYETDPGAALGAQPLCRIRRYDSRGVEPDPPSRPAAGAVGRRLRDPRDPRISAPKPRICRRGRNRRQAGAARGRRALQPLRIAGNPQQPERSARTGDT